MTRGGRIFKVRFRNDHIQNEYEYLVLHAESEKIYFHDVIKHVEKWRIAMFDDASTYKQTMDATNSYKRWKVKARQSQKLLRKMSERLADFLKNYEIEA